MTSGDTSSRPKVVENKDEVSSMGPLVIGKPVCSSFSFACSRGRVENKNEGKYKDTWTCLLNNAPDINNKEAWKKIGERETVGEDGEMIKEIDLYMVECKKYKEFSKGALMDASSDFYQSLLELEIDDSSVDFINAYFRKNKPNGVWEKVTYALTKWISSNNWTSEDFKDFTGEFGSTFKELTKEIGRLTLATAANDPVGKAIAIFNIIGAAARLLKMTFIDAFPAVKELMETIVDTFNEK